MARRRTIETRSDLSKMLLPKRLLVTSGLSSSEQSAVNREKRKWFTDRGIDPADWTTVSKILNESKQAHGIETTLERARRMKIRAAEYSPKETWK